jgi:hypothetical protein
VAMVSPRSIDREWTHQTLPRWEAYPSSSWISSSVGKAFCLSPSAGEQMAKIAQQHDKRSDNRLPKLEE